ncbi:MULTISPECIES: PilN domain-containing protein [Pandoraea]|uniref:PilN domain-containing protein n=1 Tax=Pandoraea TaxID=93217 RepID=UPI001F5E2C0B|nr:MULTISPECIES: PilN domain-containing protein [Pandoraea]
MRMSAELPPLDFLPTLAQRRQRDFRRQWRIWLGIAACGAFASLGPIAWDEHQRRESKLQRVALRAASEKLSAEVRAFDTTVRKLGEMQAHRRATSALVGRRQPAAQRLLDVMRACADGVRLTLVKTVDEHLRLEGYATTQSRVRETQKRLRALPWVRKVAEVESSVVPESVRRQWAAGQASAAMPNVRRFTLRIELRQVPVPVVLAGVTDIDADVDRPVTEEVPDVR